MRTTTQTTDRTTPGLTAGPVTLRANGRELSRSYLRELSRRWELLDPATIEAGAAWYPAAGRSSRELSSYLERGRGRQTGAAILAALSPRCQWSVNLRWAGAIVQADPTGPAPEVHTELFRDLAWSLRTGRLAARAMLDLDTRGVGLKVRSFYQNLCGYGDPVTCDVWATRAAGAEDAELDRKGGYQRIEAAYQALADRLGRRPCDVQAAIWMDIRGAKPTDPAAFSVRPAR